MNKKEFAALIAQNNNITKTEAKNVIDIFTESVMSALSEDKSVSLIEFGSFETRHVPERIGRNPKTGESVKIKAHNRPQLKISKTIREACN